MHHGRSNEQAQHGRRQFNAEKRIGRVARTPMSSERKRAQRAEKRAHDNDAMKKRHIDLKIAKSGPGCTWESALRLWHSECLIDRKR